jgi:hypothetical protein
VEWSGGEVGAKSPALGREEPSAAARLIPKDREHHSLLASICQDALEHLFFFCYEYSVVESGTSLCFELSG